MMNKPIYRSLEGKSRVQEPYLDILKLWKKPSIKHNIATRFGNTFVIESGPLSVSTIVLLHGSGSNSAMWLSDVAILSESYRTFAIDIIGECGLSAESRPPFSNGNYRMWLKDVLNGLAINKTSLIGCSLGGWIAIDFAISEPEMVENLVLLAPAGITPIRVKTLFTLILASLTGKWGFRLMNQMVYGGQKIDTKAMEFISLVKEHFIPRNDLLPVFTDKELGKIVASTLFIGGEKDCFYDSHASANRIKDNIKTQKTIIIPEYGHVLIGITSLITNFLNNNHG